MRKLVATLVLILSLAPFAAPAAESCAACDLDGNGVGGRLADVGVMMSSMWKKTGEPGFKSQADFDGNGVVNLVDWAVFLRVCRLAQ